MNLIPVTFSLLGKKKLLKEIGEMIEDHEFFIEMYSNRGHHQRAAQFEVAKDSLRDLVYYIEYNERVRPLHKRK